MKARTKQLLFSALGTIVVLWVLLLPGYVLTLDLVAGPHMVVPRTVGTPLNDQPFRFAEHILNLFLAGWIVEKILLAVVIFLLFYLPLRYYPFEKKYGQEYLAALFFAINPFVYERFLAGQWAVLLGYALMAPLFYFLNKYLLQPTWKNAWFIMGTLFVTGIASLHFLVIGAIVALLWGIYGASYLWWTKRRDQIKAFAGKLLITAIALGIASGYWVIPYIRNAHAIVSTFTGNNWDAFATVGDSHIGAVGNVLSLQGFWGEGYNWVTQFILPKSMPMSFFISLGILLVLAVLGIIFSIKNKSSRPLTLSLIFVFIISTLFSLGVSASFARPLNLWLFNHISFWKGFRDTEKWSALIALFYAYFMAQGIAVLIERRGYFAKWFILSTGALLILLCTPQMLFGFSGQIKPVWYPSSWAEVNQTLETIPNCKTLFLPWHEYYSLSFNHSVLTSNVASHYFNCNIVSAENVEIGSVQENGDQTQEYNEIDAVVTDNIANPENTIALLKSKGINSIILADDVLGSDQFKYPFLRSRQVHLLLHSQGLYFFSI